jgi:hypothetical protein
MSLCMKQVEFEANIQLVEANCKQAWMSETKPSKHIFQRLKPSIQVIKFNSKLNRANSMLFKLKPNIHPSH